MDGVVLVDGGDAFGFGVGGEEVLEFGEVVVEVEAPVAGGGKVFWGSKGD